MEERTTAATLGFGTFGGTALVRWGEASILAYTGLTEVGYVNVVPAPAGLATGAMITVRRRRR